MTWYSSAFNVSIHYEVFVWKEVKGIEITEQEKKANILIIKQ
jgi:uncharacterized protein YcfL